MRHPKLCSAVRIFFAIVIASVLVGPASQSLAFVRIVEDFDDGSFDPGTFTDISSVGFGSAVVTGGELRVRIDQACVGCDAVIKTAFQVTGDYIANFDYRKISFPTPVSGHHELRIVAGASVDFLAFVRHSEKGQAAG